MRALHCYQQPVQTGRGFHEWCIHRPPARSTPARLSPVCRQRWSAGRGRRSPAGVRAGVSINDRKKSESAVEDRPPFSPWCPCSWAWSNRFRTFKDGITVSNVRWLYGSRWRLQVPAAKQRLCSSAFKVWTLISASVMHLMRDFLDEASALWLLYFGHCSLVIILVINNVAEICFIPRL